MRKFNRKNDESREILIETNYSQNSDGSCLISYGNTKVICTASIDKDIPRWLLEKESGWITAEYSMLPGSTNTRNKRESKLGKQAGRTIEIQRIIGRSLRSVVDLKKLVGFQIIVDCDVIQADGGTRTASITGGFVALSLALRKYINKGILKSDPIRENIAAISCGIVKGTVMVDLDYEEDSLAEVDANFVISEKSGFSEVQITGEEKTFCSNSINEMLDKSQLVIKEIFKIQKDAIK